jgi:RNA polymerase sigma-70 factor (ECF subfamily)
MADATVPGLVEHLFRHEAGRLLARLGRRLGPEHLDLAEEVVQDALVQALRRWPFQGVPSNPAAWLAHVAHNRALDLLRRQAAFDRIRTDLEQRARTAPASAEAADAEALDDQLAMMFACCHPSLAPESRVALTLKAACGFSTTEVGRAFLVDEPTVAQRIVRAKRLLRDESVAVSVPPPSELAGRLDSVLQVLYLLFNEGYSACQGEDLVRHDLCAEALRLGLLLTRRPDTARPAVHALVSLMLFQASRLPARVDGSGDLLLLADQDRSLWDERLIHAGLRHLDRASAGDEMTTYHIEAGMAAIHAQAPSEEATDWPRLLWLYDLLWERSPTPVVALNRAVVVARIEGPEAGLAALEPHAWALRGYCLLHATRAEFLLRLGRRGDAEAAYGAALTCPCSDPERRFLQGRLKACRASR